MLPDAASMAQSDKPDTFTPSVVNTVGNDLANPIMVQDPPLSVLELFIPPASSNPSPPECNAGYVF